MTGSRIQEIYWLAGLMEGEGSFGAYASGLRIKLTMTDKDVVERAKEVLHSGRKMTEYQPPSPEGKDYKLAYCVTLDGRLADSWMMTLWPLLGQRRRQCIEECLRIWRSKVAPLPLTRLIVPCSNCGQDTPRLSGGGPRLCRPCFSVWRKPYTARARA